MRSTKLQAATFAILLAFCLQTSAVDWLLQRKPLPPSYPLLVRGGGNLRVWTENAEYRRGVKIAKLIVEFEPGTNRAGDGLRPGQGSWLDRAMRQGEPIRLEYFVFEGDPQKIIDPLRASGHYYTFECFNTGKGYLQATKAYPK